MPNPRVLVVTLVVFGLAAGACVSSSDAGRPPAVRIVAAFFPLAEAARRVAPGWADVVDLTPRGAEPHDIELRPHDLLALRRADLIFYVGGGFQPAVEDAVRSLPHRERARDVVRDLPVRAGDPHVWLDPVLMQTVVRQMGVEIANLDPARAAVVVANVDAYVATLRALDESFRIGLRSCAHTDLFTSHEAFGYLAARYGLTQVAIAGLSPEAEPAPRRLQEIARLVRITHATTIFFESLVSSRVAATVARATGARTALLNPIEGLTPQQAREHQTYLSLMRENLRALTEGLQCR